MTPRPFGTTGLAITPLGFGAMQLGDPALAEAAAARLLNHALDLGIRLIDTARGYGLSEERIGRHIGARRDEYVLSTKVGYGVPGRADWTWDCIVDGIDQARQRLGTDVIDIAHLHSCDRAMLERGEVTAALVHCVERGAVRVAAYSGDGAALEYALDSGAFGSVQASLNLCDQAARPTINGAAARGVGVLTKRPLAGRPWAEARPVVDAAESDYRRRFGVWRAAYGREAANWQELSLRFSAWEDGVGACLVGGVSESHLAANVAHVMRGPLPAAEHDAIIAAFDSHGRDWHGWI